MDILLIIGAIVLAGAGTIAGMRSTAARRSPVPLPPPAPAPLPIAHWRCRDCGREAVPEWYDGRCYRCYHRYAELVMKQAAILVASRARIQDIDTQLALLLAGVPEVWQPFDDGARG